MIWNQCRKAAWAVLVLWGAAWAFGDQPENSAADNAPPEEPSVSESAASDGLVFGVSQFLTEQLPVPQGIDTPKPRFSWKLAAEHNGEKQSAYQLRLLDFDDETVLWDSGKIESARQSFVPYTGDDLKPATPYLVELTVWNKDGSVQDTVSSCFSTGLWPTEAEPAPWKGKWIGLNEPVDPFTSPDMTAASWIGYEGSLSLAVGKSVYRKTFEVNDPGTIQRAVANVTGDDTSRIFFNGELLGAGGTGKIAPAYELTGKLLAGKNVLIIEANNGGGSPNPGGAAGVITLVGSDDSVTLLPTDTTWKAKQGSEEAWYGLDFDDSDWTDAAIITQCGKGPWGEVKAGKAVPNSIPARYLAKTFTLDGGKQVKRAVAYFCGLGYSELFIDGEKIGDRVCDPVLTEYDKRAAYNTYDVTDLIQYAQNDVQDANDGDENGGEKSENGVKIDIGAALGSGRFYAPRQDGGTKNYGVPRMIFQLDIEFEDGSRQLIVSDESWTGTTDGPIQENNDYDGEVCDNRRLIAFDENAENVFTELRFGRLVSVATSQPVEILDSPAGELVATMMPPMRVNAQISPLSVNEVKPGVWVYDFGQNFVGWCRLAVQGDAGTEVTLRFAEMLHTEGENAGTLYVDNLRSAKCRDIFILGESDETQYYEPRFTYHGFRYVELTGYPGTPDLETLTGCIVGTDLAQVGAFECSDPTITQFVKNIEWGVRGNYVSIPVDCPQRDERQGWQGDRAAESKGEMYLFDNITLYRKWLQDIEDTQRDDGNVSDVAPPYWQLYSTNVTWPSAMTIIPDSLYTMYGDTDAIAQHYESRKKWLAHLQTFIKEDGTIDKDNYGDWCVPPEDPILIHSQDPARKTDPGLLATAYYVYNLKLMAKDAKLLGKGDDEKKFLDRAAKTTADFNQAFYNAEKGCYSNGTQTSSVLPLAFGMVPEENRASVFAALVDNIENVTNKHLGTGLIGAQWLNRILSDNGRIDLSYTFATNRTYPSWGYMLSKGATTVWELWNGDTADPAMNSGNHVMLVGDLGVWYFEYLAGIKADPEKPGFEHIIMKPNVVGDLAWVDASYDSVRGVVASSWAIDEENGKFIWTVIVPVNAAATAFVPTTGSGEEVTLEGVDGVVEITDKTVVDGRVAVPLGSGLWQMTSEWKK